MMHIGPLGNLIAVRSPATFPSSPERAGKSLTLSNGQGRTYRSPRTKRSWTWGLDWATDEDVDNLIALEQGAFGPGPYRFYDPMAAVMNMLPDVLAAIGTGPAPWRWVGYSPTTALPGGPITLDDGRTLANSIIPQQTLTFPVRNNQLDPIPVFPGRTYTFTAHLAGGSGTLTLIWTDANGDPLIGGMASSLHDTGRIEVTGTAPAPAAGVLLSVAAGDINSTLNLQGLSYARTPDTAALDFAGNFEISADIAPNFYQAVGNDTIISKYELTGNQRSWQLLLTPAGQLQLYWSPNGTTAISKLSTVSVPGDPGERLRIKATLDVDNGAGQNVVRFYTGPPSSAIWNQLGTTILTTGATSVFNSTAPVEIGSRSGGTGQFEGRIYSVQVRNGIGGPLVASPDFTFDGPWLVGDSSATAARNDSAGRPWTLYGASVIDEVITSSQTTQVGGMQLTETAEPIEWRAGMGMPHVQISGFDNLSNKRLSSTEKYRDVSFTMNEEA